MKKKPNRTHEAELHVCVNRVSTLFHLSKTPRVAIHSHLHQPVLKSTLIQISIQRIFKEYLSHLLQNVSRTQIIVRERVKYRKQSVVNTSL